MKRYTQQEIDDILEKHKLWLEMKDGGEQADFSHADVRGMNFDKKDLRDARFYQANGACASFMMADCTYANFHMANLRSAIMNGAILRRAYFSETILFHALLPHDIISFGRIGSEKRMTNVNLTTNTVWCGCFTGTLEEFEEKVKKAHGDSVHGKEYAAAIAYIRAIKASHEKGTEK